MQNYIYKLSGISKYVCTIVGFAFTHMIQTIKTAVGTLDISCYPLLLEIKKLNILKVVRKLFIN